MNRVCVLVILMFACTGCSSENTKDSPRRIEVTGTAEKEIVPDKIYVSLSLKEYKRKKTNEIVSISALEDQFLDAMKKVSIERNNLVINDIYSFSYWH